MSTDPFKPPGTVPFQPRGAMWLRFQGRTRSGEPWPMVDVYDASVDLDKALDPDLREAYKRHLLTPGMPAAAFVALSVFTFGAFAVIYPQLKQSRLPMVRPDDPSTGKAIGLMLVPLFNIYWYFVVWRRLVDRIDFQYRLRGYPPPINREQVMIAQVVAFAGWFLFGIVGFAGCVWLLVLGARLQSASNRLAEREV